MPVLIRRIDERTGSIDKIVTSTPVGHNYVDYEREPQEGAQNGSSPDRPISLDITEE